MKPIEEVRRIKAPFPRPQGLAWDGARMWMTSVATDRVYAVDPASLTVQWETAAPGKPWGVGVVPGELRVVCDEGTPEVRIIRRCLPFKGFDTHYRIPCPDGCGSHFSWDGSRLQLSQWYPQKILALNEAGAVERSISVPHQIVGQVWLDGGFFLITTDDENTTDYWVTRVELAKDGEVRTRDLAHVPFAARALAYDGEKFWTNHREQGETVCFVLPQL